MRHSTRFVWEKKEMSQVFEAEMGRGKEGVVLFSLGSNVNTAHLPAEFMEHVFQAMAALPDVHFIAKVDKHDEVFMGNKDTFRGAGQRPAECRTCSSRSGCPSRPCWRIPACGPS